VEKKKREHCTFLEGYTHYQPFLGAWRAGLVQAKTRKGSRKGNGVRNHFAARDGRIPVQCSFKAEPMKMDEVIVILFGLLLVLPLFVLYLLYMNRVYMHEVTPDAIRVRLLGFMTLRKVPLAEIDSIELVATNNLPDPTVVFYAEKWPGKPFAKEGVIVKKRSGLSKVLLMSPDKPAEFIEKVNSLRQQAKSRLQ